MDAKSRVLPGKDDMAKKKRMPRNAKAKLERVRSALRTEQSTRFMKWVDLFVLLGNAESAISTSNVEGAAGAMVRASQIEAELTGDCEKSGFFADELEDLAYGE